MRALVRKVQHRVPASTILKFFKFPKPPRECLQQLVKVSSQSDERCGLLYDTHTQTLIFMYKIVEGIYSSIYEH